MGSGRDVPRRGQVLDAKVEETEDKAQVAAGDDLATREFLRDHRHLFVPLADLERARDALKARIDQAKIAAKSR